MIKHSESSSMGKIWIEICLISARGLPRSSLLKPHWYAVGWIDPNDKYCTKIDASGNPNPVWKTKFTTVIDVSETDSQDLSLHIEVYSRDPLFLREKLRGTATVGLKEFLAKYSKSSDGSKLAKEEVGSFQLRKKGSNKPQGFVDVSVRISEEKEGTSSYSYLGSEEGFNLRDGSYGITLATDAGPSQGYPPPAEQSTHPSHLPRPQQPGHHPYTYPSPYPTTYPNPPAGMRSYPPPGMPSYPTPPPPPPSNAGYISNFIPRVDNRPTTSYVNMPSSGVGAGRGGGGPGFGAGLGAGALAAGAVIFGDDLMSGFELPSGMHNARLTISADPPF